VIWLHDEDARVYGEHSRVACAAKAACDLPLKQT